jgi:outer membrane immunogenic protein
MRVQISRKAFFASSAAVTALAATSTAVVAQDWTGGFVGLSFGSTTGNASADGLVSEYDIRSRNASAFIGYDHQLGNGFVLGGELSAMIGPTPLVDTEYGTSFNNVVDVKVRLGKAFGNTLLYGTVGVSSAEETYFDNDTQGAMGSKNGTNFGIGVEHRIGKNFTIGAEYTRRLLDTTYNSSSALDTVAIRGVIRF